MTTYPQLARPVSWTLLFGTLLLAILLAFSIGLVSSILALVQHIIVPEGEEQPWHFGRALWLASAILLPALILAPFYYAVATRQPSTGRATFGWITSIAYHSLMTVVLLFLLPGTVEVSGGLSLRMPLACFSAAAAVVSLVLLIRYPRPPRLPVSNAG